MVAPVMVFSYSVCVCGGGGDGAGYFMLFGQKQTFSSQFVIGLTNFVV